MEVNLILFLFIILIGAIVILYLYYDNKIMLLKRQLLVLNSQYSKLKEKSNINISSQKIIATFTTPSVTTSCLNSNSNIYLAPLINSPILQCTIEPTDVRIIDSVIINSSSWFYISFPHCTINNRGWVLEKDLSF